MKTNRNVPQVLALFVLSASLLLSGCGNKQTDGSNRSGNTGDAMAERGTGNVRIVKNKKGVPMQNNTELGVELPINVYTDWKVVDKDRAKYVIYYSDPYKQGYPPYEEGKSPDIEKIIYINNFDKDLYSDVDIFEGTWIGGLNERTQNTVMIPSNKMDRNKEHYIGAFHITKSTETGQYEINGESYMIKDAQEETIEKWQRLGLGDPIDLTLAEGFPKHSGYDSYYHKFDEKNSKIRVDGNKLSVDLYDSNSKVGHLEMIYHPENDSIEIEKIFFSQEYSIHFWDFTGCFNLRKNHDILKRYPSFNENELMAGLLQMKIDQMKDAHPEFTGYRNLMLNYEHREYIPGSVDLTKPPEFPPLPEFPTLPEDRK